jgi:uncharacterized protein (TIGR02453 family)
MAFSGFGPQALPFFKALAFHQKKEWFEANRATYEDEVKGPLGDLVEDLASAFAAARIPLKGDRKASVFRLNRDVRFAKDKSPYKTHAGAVMTRGGTKSDPGLLYIHIAPEGCFTAAGFYYPEPTELSNLRRAIARAPKAWTQMQAKLGRAELTLAEDDLMKRLPKGFEDVADVALAQAVKHKSFVVSRPLPAKSLKGPGLVAEVKAFAGDALPLLEWGWSAIIDNR